VCNAGWSGPACEYNGNSFVGLVESILRIATATYTFNNDRNNTDTVLFSNLLPCDEEANPYCTEPTFVFSSGETDRFVPFFTSALQADSMNICVDEVPGSIGNISNGEWIPSHYLPLAMQMPCNQVTNDGLFFYTISARFTTHPSIPTNLRNRTFFLSCGLRDKTFAEQGGLTFSVNNPCQYATQDCTTGTDADKIFALLGYEGTYQEYCSVRL